MAKAKEAPEAKGETKVEQGTTPLESPQPVNKPKETVTLPNGTVIEHY